MALSPHADPLKERSWGAEQGGVAIREERLEPRPRAHSAPRRLGSGPSGASLHTGWSLIFPAEEVEVRAGQGTTWSLSLLVTVPGAAGPRAHAFNSWAC